MWKDAVGWEGLYQISNRGNVISLKFNQVRYLVGQDNGHGYTTVHFRRRGVNVRLYIHRLVAEAFLANTENKPCVNHIDNDRRNNDVKNLEWCTYQENTNHAVKHGKIVRGEKTRSSKLTEAQVLQIRVDTSSSKELATKFGISREQINRIKRRVSWSWLKKNRPV